MKADNEWPSAIENYIGRPLTIEEYNDPVACSRALHAEHARRVRRCAVKHRIMQGIILIAATLAIVAPALGDGPDLDGNGIVDGSDLGMLLSAGGWSGDIHAADLNSDGKVDGGDLGIMLGAWGATMPTSIEQTIVDPLHGGMIAVPRGAAVIVEKYGDNQTRYRYRWETPGGACHVVWRGEP